MKHPEWHASLSVECFNGVWTLLEKEDRTPEEDALMREMAHASLFHWMMREDVTPRNRSIGLWQVSRVSAVLEDGPVAMRYARDCVTLSEDA